MKSLLVLGLTIALVLSVAVTQETEKKVKETEVYEPFTTEEVEEVT